MVYLPAVVPGLPAIVTVLGPPHAVRPPAPIRKNIGRLSIVRQLRLRRGITRTSTQARVAPATLYPARLGCLGTTSALDIGAVVENVSVAVSAVAPVILTGVVELKLNVGGSWAPVGLDVTAAVSATLPVNPPLGVTVMVDVLPLVAPGLTVTAEPVIAKLGGTAAVTITELVAVAGL